MGKRIEMKDCLKNILAAIFVVAMLLLPMFNLLYFPTDKAANIVKMNGFDVMNAAETFEDAGIKDVETWAIFQWIFFAVAILTILVYFASDRQGGVFKFLIAFCIIYCIFYLIEGIVLLGDINEDIRASLKAKDVDKDEWDEYFWKTAAFWPLILFVVCGIALYLVEAYMLSDSERAYMEQKYHYQPQQATSYFGQATAPQTMPSRKEPTISEEKKLEILVKWKELLDSGIISQEDFDKKKKEFI